MKLESDPTVVRLKAEIDDLSDRLLTAKDALNDYAVAMCPVKVGDTMVGHRGRTAIVTEVWLAGDYLRFKGHWTRKDGTQGKDLHELYSFDGWRKP